MIHNEEIKNYLLQSGADLCGIAGIERFSDAPEGYHPTDVLPDCKSVIVIAKKFFGRYAGMYDHNPLYDCTKYDLRHHG